MPMGIIEKFQKEREELNQLVMEYAGQGTKRFYSLDSQAYREGALPCKVKELLGLVASFVLRCDDCIKYHIIRGRGHDQRRRAGGSTFCRPYRRRYHYNSASATGHASMG